MSKISSRRIGVSFALLCAAAPVWTVFGGNQPQPKNEYFVGKVIRLAEFVEKHGSKLDADAAPHWLALSTDKGKVYPLVQDDGARMFFKDAKLLNRPMRLTGKLLPGSQLLQVVEVHSLLHGSLHEVFYWCDICSIKRYEKKDCDCCGAPMVLREEPVKK
jgi:hypothetical protein